MKIRNSSRLLAGILVILGMGSCDKKRTSDLRFINPLEIERIHEVVTINYNDFSNEAGDLPPGMLPLFMDAEDTLIFENIDINYDGTPEEILVEISLPAKGQKDIKIEFVPSGDFPFFPQKTNVHFAFLDNPQVEIDTASRIPTTKTEVTAPVFQMEGPAWENDKVGFRNYYDFRNGMDIFGKKASFMVLDTIGTGKHSYHLMSNWGMDILKVGTSLGAGGIGMEKDGKLFRIGDNGNSGFERIYEGPLKSEFVFYFSDWKAGEESFDITHYISITSGTYRYENAVIADFPDSSHTLISGFVNKHSDSLIFDNAGAEHIMLASHDIQAEDTAALGMGVLIPRNIFISSEKAPSAGEGITETYFARMQANNSDLVQFYFYAGWATGNPSFMESVNFTNMIREDALKLENPIRIQKLILP